MTADSDDEQSPSIVVNAPGAVGVDVGDQATRIICTFDPRTWTDRDAPPPLGRRGTTG